MSYERKYAGHAAGIRRAVDQPQSVGLLIGLGCMAALVLIMAIYLICSFILSGNDKRSADRRYQIEHMSQTALAEDAKTNEDARMEQRRRIKEATDAIRAASKR